MKSIEYISIVGTDFEGFRQACEDTENHARKNGKKVIDRAFFMSGIQFIAVLVCEVSRK